MGRASKAAKGLQRLKLRTRAASMLLWCLMLSLILAPVCCLHVSSSQHSGASIGRIRPVGASLGAAGPLRLKGGEGKPGAAPDPKHVIVMGTVCGAILLLNEFDLLSVVLRVGLTFFLAIVFLLSGVNKTSDSFHRPTHLFLASMFPDICRKVWRPVVEKSVNMCCRLVCKVFKGLESYCGRIDDKTFKLARDVAASVTPTALMTFVGQIEVWCGMFMLISLAGTGSRGYRVPLAELRSERNPPTKSSALKAVV
jgi:hypothetical protein